MWKPCLFAPIVSCAVYQCIAGLEQTVGCGWEWMVDGCAPLSGDNSDNVCYGGFIIPVDEQ